MNDTGNRTAGYRAAEALAWIGRPAVTSLAAAISSPNATVRQRALHGAIRWQLGVSTPWPYRTDAAAAVPALQRVMLGDPDRESRLRAKVLLGKIPPEARTNAPLK